jgi:hypothetical protein
MASLFDGDPDGAGWRFDHWQPGKSSARIVWQDEQGAEHLCVATEEAWALEQLAVIEREPGYRPRVVCGDRTTAP